jgi:hypothetical protein
MALFQQDNPPFLSRLFQLYLASDFNSTVYQREQWFGDAIVSCMYFSNLELIYRSVLLHGVRCSGV